LYIEKSVFDPPGTIAQYSDRPIVGAKNRAIQVRKLCTQGESRKIDAKEFVSTYKVKEGMRFGF